MCAIEMALLGHKVTVLEGRDECRRLNVLKMWEETIGDLSAWPATDPDYSNERDLRASTSRSSWRCSRPRCCSACRSRWGDHQRHARGRARLPMLGDRLPASPRRFADTCETLEELDGEPFGEAPVPDKQSAAIAIVAHFEYSDRTEESKQWTRAFEAFD